MATQRSHAPVSASTAPPMVRCMRPGPTPSLATVSGYRVEADGAVVGEVETPLFPGAAGQPDYLVVRPAAVDRTRRIVIPVVLVRAVDHVRRSVTVAASGSTIDALPGNLPLGRRL